MMTKTMMTKKHELVELFMIAGGDRAHAEKLVEDIAAGRLTLPTCFNIRSGTRQQTERAHELARALAAN